MEELLMQETLLKVDNLKKYFIIQKGLFFKNIRVVRAVDGVSFVINKGETLGLVGESGSGKTTVGRTILRLIEPTEGKIYLKNENIVELDKKELRKIRQKMQIVFQDPLSSLDPRMVINKIVSEPLRINKITKGPELKKRVLETLEKVGLGKEHINRYPHELSGGQKQRVGIARAIITNPDLIVLDEPTSSLDVSVQAMILNLLKDIQKELKVGFLFISHDISVIKHISDKIAVMYAGKIVEMAPREYLFKDPKHPYLQALLSSVPVPDPDYVMKRILLKGEVPSPVTPPPGCRFHPRCKLANSKCRVTEPKLVNIGNDHFVACLLDN
jgi:oligopeptide/dipeptide ABC transporter ATP-binding protein